MPQTLSELRTSLRERISELNPRQFPDIYLNKLINEGARDLCRRTECLRDTWTIATAPATQQYTGPSNIVRLHRVEVEDSDGSRTPLEYRDFQSMDHVWHTSQATASGDPLLYTTWGMPPNLKVILYPTPSNAGTLRLHYYRFPTAAISDATAIEVPEGWEDAVVTYAEYKAWRRDGDSRWQDSKAIYEEVMADLLVTAVRYNDQSGSVDEWGNGFGLPAWLTDGDY
jgi:hypothetical protein